MGQPLVERTPPAWLVLAGAAFAASLGTIVPGLALTLHDFDLPSSDLVALVPEAFVAAVMTVLARSRIRSQWMGGGRAWSVALLGANVALVGFAGLVFVFVLASGSVDSGPAVVIGLLVVVMVMAVHLALGISIWRLLAKLANPARTTSSRDAPGPLPASRTLRATSRRRPAATWK